GLAQQQRPPAGDGEIDRRERPRPPARADERRAAAVDDVNRAVRYSAAVGGNVCDDTPPLEVTRGLDPRVHPLRKNFFAKRMDCRVKPGNDDCDCCICITPCSVCSPPQPNPGLPGFGHFKICRKRASPQPAGEGLGVGVRQRITAPPPPRRSAAKLAQAAQACLRAPTLPTRGRVRWSPLRAQWRVKGSLGPSKPSV